MAVTPGSYVTPPPMANGATPPAVGGRFGGGGHPAIGGWRPGSDAATPADQGIAGGSAVAPHHSSLRVGSLGSTFGGTAAETGKPAKRKVGFGSRLNFAWSSARCV